VPSTKYDQGWPGRLAACAAGCATSPLLVRFRSRSRSLPRLPATRADSSLTRVSVPVSSPLHGGGIRKSLRRARARRFANFSENFSAAATSEKPGRTRRRRGEPVNALATLDSLVASPFCDFDLCSRERRKEKGKRGRNCDRTVCCGRVMQMQRGQAKINLQRGGRRGTDEDGVTE
jgi:hypothetical protein